MGYHVTYYMAVQIRPEHFAGALTAINELHNPDNLRAHASGGAYGGGKPREIWYAWVSNPGPDGFSTLEEALQAWRFGTHTLQNDALALYFTGEKHGDEQILFERLAPFMEGTIKAMGEDGEQWGYCFRDGKIIDLRIQWVEL